METGKGKKGMGLELFVKISFSLQNLRSFICYKCLSGSVLECWIKHTNEHKYQRKKLNCYRNGNKYLLNRPEDKWKWRKGNVKRIKAFPFMDSFSIDIYSTLCPPHISYILGCRANITALLKCGFGKHGSGSRYFNSLAPSKG